MRLLRKSSRPQEVYRIDKTARNKIDLFPKPKKNYNPLAFYRSQSPQRCFRKGFLPEGEQ